jgi:DNA-binding transcriptional ArsR family regulator
MPPAVSTAAADDVFAALAHSVRRELLDLLAGGERTAGQLAAPFDMSRPAVSQHLRVLRDARLVAERPVGRERVYRLQPERLRDVATWLARYERFWGERLAALGRYLDESAKEENA